LAITLTNATALRHISLGTKAAIVFVAYALAMLTLIGVMLQQDAEREADSLAHERLIGLTRASEDYIHDAVDDIDRDIKFLATSQAVQDLRAALEQAAPQAIARSSQAVQRLLMDFVPKRSGIYQARVINARTGYEVVRIERKRPFGAFAPGPLQDKRGRDYFEALSHYPADHLYISNVTLNRENGAIEVPHRPTIRFGRAVAGSDGSTVLFVVLNVSFNTLSYGLNGLIGTLAEPSLFDQNGRVLSHPDSNVLCTFETEQAPSIDDLFGVGAIPQASGPSRHVWHITESDDVVHLHRVRLHAESDQTMILALALPRSVGGLLNLSVNNYSALWLAGALLVLGVLLFVILGWFLVTPLRHLIDQLHAYQLGEHTARPGTGMLDRRDEFGALARGLLGMTLRVETQMASTQKARAESQRVFDAAATGMIIANRNGVIQGFNRAAEALFGWTVADVVGRHWSVLVTPEDAVQMKKTLSRLCAESDGPDWRSETQTVQAVRRDDTPFPAALRVSALKTHGSRRFLVIIRDMSNELALSLARSESAAKSRFLANMSHELRTPLNAVTLHAEMIADEAQDSGNEILMEDARHIKGAANHLLDLINGILDLARIESGVLELAPVPMDLCDFVNDLKTIGGALARKNNNAFVIETEGLPATVTLDRVRLRQCALNLISNAAKFTQHGTITLSVRHRPDVLHLRVRDTGVGMSKEELERIFRMFEQANSYVHGAYGGSGVGLALTRTIVELMDGTISVESAPDAGTCFDIAVPLAQAQVSQTEPDSPPLLRVVPTQTDRSEPDQITAEVPDVPEVLNATDPHGPQLVCTQPKLGLNALKASSLPTSSLVAAMAAMRDSRTDSQPTCPVATALKSGKSVTAAACLCDQPGCLILIVEDDLALLNAIGRAVTHLGLVPIKLDNGEDAVRFLSHAVPAILILDLSLPRVSGEQIIRIAKADPRLQDMPITVVTARDLSRAHAAWLSEQCHSVLRKGDFDLEDLAAGLIDIIRMGPAKARFNGGAGVEIQMTASSQIGEHHDKRSVS